MAMRNWWINAVIDGRKSDLYGGPQSKDGGFYLTIRQRDKGQSVSALIIRGWMKDDGELVLECDPCFPASRCKINDGGSFTIKTQR